MAEYLIQENTLVEMADIIREQFEYYDTSITLTSARNIDFLNIIIPDGTVAIGNWAFHECETLKRVTIPDSIIRIGNSAFYDCKNLESVIIPSHVISIGEFVFYNCTSLTNLYLYPITPPLLTHEDGFITDKATIHVPVGCGDAYKTATNWSAFADRIVEDIVIE